jgi:hypothetical protein
MRTQTLWGGQRRAARMHWWRQVVDRPVQANWDELLDEMVLQRFRLHDLPEPAPRLPARLGTS